MNNAKVDREIEAEIVTLCYDEKIEVLADMHRHVIGDSPNANLMAYADDSTIYAHAKSMDLLKTDLERLSDRMISYS